MNIFNRIKQKIIYEFRTYFGINEYLLSTKSGKKILLIASYDPNGIITVLQTIFQYCTLSKFSVDVLNVRDGFGSLPEALLHKYEVIIVHDTASGSVQGLQEIGAKILNKFNGIKVIIKQDEYSLPYIFADFFHQNKIDLLLTLWDLKTAERVYKREGKNSSLQLMHFLTGYVPDEYTNYGIDDYPRNIDVGYRGSAHSLLLGKMASYEKREMGYLFAPYAAKCGLKCDVSGCWEDRFMGEDWLFFLKHCKAVLGVESGSDIVDYTGEVKTQYEKYMRENPKATEEEILDFVEQFKGEITYRVISPRHLEAAACGALQILYEGEYQGILKPYVHYVPLKRDYSNIEEVIDYIKDDAKRKKIVTQAREDLILSGKYSFRKFAEALDSKIEELIKERGGKMK